MAEKGRTNVTSYRVIYGDTDQMGVAYYGNYLRWFEIGRTEFLREIGFAYKSVEEMGFHFPVVEVSCRYLKPARYDETVTIETALASVGPATLDFSYRVYGAGGKLLLAEGRTRHGCVTRDGKVARIPPELGERLKEAISGGGS